MIKTIYKLCKNPTISNLGRNIIEGGMITVKNNIKNEIGNTINKKIIDFACGTGKFCKLAKGEYVGIDLNETHIKYANQKYSSNKKQFLVKDAKTTDYPNKYFDIAFMLSFLHHISNQDTKKILNEIKRITKEKVIIVDLVPLKYNFVGKIFYKMDQGKYIRPYEKQLKLISKCLTINKSKIFRSGLNLHSLIICNTK